MRLFPGHIVFIMFDQMSVSWVKQLIHSGSIVHSNLGNGHLLCTQAVTNVTFENFIWQLKNCVFFKIKWLFLEKAAVSWKKHCPGSLDPRVWMQLSVLLGCEISDKLFPFWLNFLSFNTTGFTCINHPTLMTTVVLYFLRTLFRWRDWSTKIIVTKLTNS